MHRHSLSRHHCRQRRRIAWIRRTASALLLCCVPHLESAFAEATATIELIQGNPEILRPKVGVLWATKGGKLELNDTLRNRKSSFVDLEFIGESRITVTPNSSLEVRKYSFNEAASQAEANLFMRGQVRVTSGKVARLSEGKNFHISTVFGTGIVRRGSSVFAEGRSEEQHRGDSQFRIQDRLVAGRLVSGSVTVTSSKPEKHASPVRNALTDWPIEAGEQLQTKAGETAIIVFRDRTILSLAEHTKVVVDKFDIPAQKEAKGARQLTVLAGMVRISHPTSTDEQLVVATASGGKVVPIGTGFDVWCLQCDDPSARAHDLVIYPWEGSIRFERPGYTAKVLPTNAGLRVPAGSGAAMELSAAEVARFAASVAPEASPERLAAKAQEHDLIPRLFGEEKENVEKGVYVHVTEGQVGLTNQDILIEIGAGETGLIEAGRPPIRVLKPPAYVLEVLRLRIDGRPLTQITGGQTASLDQGTRPRGESGVCLP